MESHKRNSKRELALVCLFSSRASSNKEVVIKSDQQINGDMQPMQSFTPVPITQTPPCNQSRGGCGDREHGTAFTPLNPICVSLNGVPCVLFWAKRITVTFENQTWLDLTEGAFGQMVAVDTHNSSCSEERATLYLKFGDTDNPEALDMRLVLARDGDGFRLLRLELLLRGSARAAFGSRHVGAPAGRSFRCGRVSSLRADALLLPLPPPGRAGTRARWEVTLLGLQLQGFAVQGGQFAKARDCAASFSPAVLIGLAMSLILLLVLAYALHMLIYLRYLDRHYECVAASPTRFPQLRARSGTEGQELLRSQGPECYELRGQPICKIDV
ncbi:PREDICTED: V-type proton ATPase subunit S1-like protein isoform X2 [Chinchilla lanigera]|uniref:V-type proton ATPase subunit S1-like protein isoform X2 n=1 Tax=Chinchilla lanigera TaxID=34839 RepID=UPI000698DE67|nr:PREDICTED: V-type proton ATPase subunit S1-like protein isoform X2 [Chinchilla lanigera]XP_013368510.1 PREDICTED: V-type proton ATPase subunit S1-like protein isoform X2 [Chinchilla lanigera]XP_013368511.1 PREDICTED: V-type proton ATPase subunit S1-like protein isoform X2 [Chinchilla lanigera]XP_013368512.1 PREDICTED: V-type proton ATPase subunit S1-like protein isoform X2 [Chinchilla lanigera]